MKRRKASEQPARLLDYWQPPDGAGAPVGCIATTFTFDAPFFETECLARFAGIESDPDEDSPTYIIEREERLSQLFACVVVDRLHVPANRSLRWHVLPIGLERGILHAKVALLHWERCIRVLVGSANLTEPAYRRNLEQLAGLDFAPEGTLPRSLLLEIIRFLEESALLTPGARDDGPRRAVAGFLAGARRAAESWPEGGFARGAPAAAWAPVWPGRLDLFQQLRDAWRGSRPDRATVLSPFYDEGDGAAQTLRGLADLLVQRGPRTVRICAPGHRRPDKVVELELPECLRGEGGGPLQIRHCLVPRRQGEDGDERALHAKSIRLERDDFWLMTVGSSNFTRAGMGVGTITNIEANLLFTVPDPTSPFGRACLATAPESEELDLERDEVRFLPAASRTGDAAEVPLPLAFGAARFDPAPAPGRLLLDIAPSAPDVFSIHVEVEGGRECILDSAGWPRDRPDASAVPWRATRPPSYLDVVWRDAGGIEREAVWPVNVTETAALPPPDELRDLPLDSLLAVLTSTTPAHETLARIAARERGGKLAAATGVEIDPHRKVDASRHLLRRMRRVARALEGLRERLEKPVFRLDSLRWRLHGPFGPVALARQLATDEGEGGGFLVTEVALTVHAARIPDGPEVDLATITEEKARVIAQLETIAAAQSAPDSLVRYVRESFAEIRP